MDRKTGQFKNIPVNGVTEAVRRALHLSDAGSDTYLACAEYRTPDNRTADNVSGALGLWMDIDYGEEKAAAGKGYLTEDDALLALRQFCILTGLPDSTHIVSSGGGLHVYWVLNGEIERDVWRAFASKLKALTKAHKFLADDSRTADIASVLRIPGTSNYKYDPPRPVSLKYASNDFIERASMLDSIDRAHERLCSVPASKPPTHTAKIAHTTIDADQSIYGPPDLTRLASAMVVLEPDCDEATWKLRRLAPLADAARLYPGCAQALYTIAKSWSSGELCGIESIKWRTPGGNGRTGEEVFDGVWQRFLNSEYNGAPVTLGTIYYDARAAGWDMHFDPADQFEDIHNETGETA